MIFAVSCSHTKKKYAPETIKAESEKANALFEKIFQEDLSVSPMGLTYMGSKEKYDELGDASYEFYKTRIEKSKKDLKALKNINYEALNPQTQLSYRLMKKDIESSIESFKYYYQNYFINQMRGPHSHLPSFMINMHQIANKKDAQAYVKRVWQFKPYLMETIKNLNTQTGVEYPFFVFDKVISDSKNIITGYPFSKSKKTLSPLYNDFKKKLDKANIKGAQKKILLTDLENALKVSAKPAYEMIIEKMTSMKKENPDKAYGLWKQKNGKDYYEHLLKTLTTTDYTPEEIHKIGLSEVRRIQEEMLTIAKKLKIKGGLQDLFSHIKGNKKLFYPNTKKGRSQYLIDTKEIIAAMKADLDKLFITKPKADLIVKPVEPFREKSAGIAFYQRPALNGTRPGIYYVNLSDMSSVAKYDMEALAYHEAIPGHHMQLALAQELTGDNLPTFRKMAYYGAFIEGWGLYAEYIPKEIGKYKSLYSDFGRLSMELWRAARLVVDTGIHHHKWSYDKAVKYLKDNTPNSDDEITKGIQRYFVTPAQATTYKVGQLKILELKAHLEERLEENFDIRKFHEAVLKNGTVPLYEMERQVLKEFKNYYAK